jgi:hypothetical protein
VIVIALKYLDNVFSRSLLRDEYNRSGTTCPEYAILAGHIVGSLADKKGITVIIALPILIAFILCSLGEAAYQS